MTTRPFRFGLQASRATSLRDWTDTARKAEDLGYSTLTMADHFPELLAPGPALAVAAAATSTLRIGTLVYCNDYRHPALLAKEVATLDLMSEGRFEFGLGAGWMTVDYEQAGLTLDRPGIRIDRLVESLSICRGLFTGKPFSFDGTHYSISDMVGAPKPVQDNVPVVIGGGGRRMLSTAGREADIVSINLNLNSGTIGLEAGADGTPARTDEKIGWVKAAAGERYRDIELQTRVHLSSVTNDRAGVAAVLAEGFGLTVEDALETPHALVGTVEQICENLEHIRDRWDISYLGIGAESIDEMAPVIERMAGN
jgi:probable F420-dependent oxidoreductase